MDYPESIKVLIYNQLLHFFHLQEQRLELELKEIKELVQLHQLKGVPGSLSTIHVLDCIGNHEPINHSAIVDKLNLSKAKRRSRALSGFWTVTPIVSIRRF
ncbi:hypothetical protein [Paenibacillus chitinolyticus]|uniref:Uncharacterized protein n=1 Tax=Paenibacillus chitinolyticus TaxID=79263 RepID=A0ABT4FCQ2_9BACL|nr:hypothetical protein [Paenibacillus chitinolyticus]MCY9589955.1 hypothetical protein [Paenibacillus chitinolyticus]MCY9596292.1 hypothetical protein [Paenibacillus chitinolyticus]